ACDNDSGADVLIGSFVLDAPAAGITGEEIRVDITTTSAAVPAWWQFKNAGSCRRTSLQWMSTPPPVPSACADPFAGLALGGLGTYVVGFAGPNTVRLVGVNAGPVPSDLVPGVEYFAFGLRMDHLSTAGPTACAGCDVPVCIGFGQLRLTTASAADFVEILGG